MTPTPKALEVAAQIWCDPRVSNRVMDTELCQVIAEALAQFAEEAVKEVWQAGWNACTHEKKETRNEALEEAEKICDVISENYFQVYRASGYKGQGKEGSQAVSAAGAKIRALKSKEGA